MSKVLPRVYNIAPGPDFLKTLADQVLQGFPIGARNRPLSDWTILLPTRRAARRFGQILRQQSKAKALILPRIKPIGDLDEDRLQDESMSGDLKPALSKSALLLALSNFAVEWAAAHPEIEFAAEIAASPVQRLGLAQSLAELVETLETQEIDFAKLSEAYDADLSHHREAILSLLAVLSEKLPALHYVRGTMGRAARRSAMIHQEAKRIASGGHHGPIIAAGSTGTIPATRALLGAIARHAEGAVILPGLDLLADDASWDALPQEHGQYALKLLLSELGLKRSDVHTLGAALSGRHVLISEMMRPSATAETWYDQLPKQRDMIATGLPGLSLFEAPDRHLEARGIALILREVLEHPAKTAALVTPDRDLAARVVAELDRWNISIADSAGITLTKHGAGSVLDLLLEACLNDFSAERLLAFLHHQSVSLGHDRTALKSILQNIEVAGFRGFDLKLNQNGFAGLMVKAKRTQEKNHHAHLLVKAMTAQQWQDMATLAGEIDSLFAPLRESAEISLADLIIKLRQIVKQACSGLDWEAPEQQALADFLDDLASEAREAPIASLFENALFIQTLLRKAPAPPRESGHPRVAILGTLEARLLPFDVMVLGGLNEQIWPAQPDPGAWLNRTMREKLGLPQPERDIGLAAHDFEQGFAYGQTYLTFSKRLGGAPASPSRWLLRLKTVLATAGLGTGELEQSPFLALTQSLEMPDGKEPLSGPMRKPAPTPPAATRPRKFSVTEIEKLVRNPYAVYARRVLALEPLQAFGLAPDAALRGSLFHDAIAEWNRVGASDEQGLLAAGEKLFVTLGDDAEVKNFWWPHFQRVATWLAGQEAQLKQGLLSIQAEQSGSLSFEVSGVEHQLTARADRIDILQNAAARLIDYKTGVLPTAKQVKAGLNPQLTLEAAILLGGGFQMKPKSVTEALYLRIGGGRDGLKRSQAGDVEGAEFVALSEKHFAALKTLLGLYLQPTLPYLPRLREFKETQDADFDHLSRYLEWQLAGDA
jgi:ATP-dependent helicase/nuclease subunit B